MARVKTKVPDLIDKAEAELQLKTLSEAQSREKKHTAEMELEITAVREKYKHTLTSAKEEQQAAHALLERYAEHNYKKLFKKKKSIDMQHGSIGFRQGTPKVVKRAGITWTKMLEIFKNRALPYVRTKEEVDKEAILAVAKSAESMKKLNDVGISVVQDETFFCLPKDEETD